MSGQAGSRGALGIGNTEKKVAGFSLKCDPSTNPEAVRACKLAADRGENRPNQPEKRRKKGLLVCHLDVFIYTKLIRGIN